MDGKWDTFNYYLTAVKRKLIETTQSDPAYKKADYFMLTSIVAMLVSVVAFLFLGMCYDCYICGKENRRKITVAPRSTSVTYQDFNDEMEMQESPAKPKSSTG